MMNLTTKKADYCQGIAQAESESLTLVVESVYSAKNQVRSRRTYAKICGRYPIRKKSVLISQLKPSNIL